MHTIGDAIQAGKKGLQSQCPSCKQIVVMWWGLLTLPEDTLLADIGPRARCSKCGHKGLAVKVYEDTVSAPQGVTPKPRFGL